MKITRAMASDLPEILALQKLAFQENAIRYNDSNISPLRQTLDELIEEAQTHVILKAVVQDKIIGSVRGVLRADHAYIGRVIVHPDYQNQGIGRKLMTAIENEFDTTKFELVAGYLDDKNIALYTKLGYQIYGEEKESENLSFVQMRKETCDLQSRRLLDA